MLDEIRQTNKNYCVVLCIRNSRQLRDPHIIRKLLKVRERERREGAKMDHD